MLVMLAPHSSSVLKEMSPDIFVSSQLRQIFIKINVGSFKHDTLQPLQYTLTHTYNT